MSAAAPLPPPECFHAIAAVGWLELGSVADARAELERLKGQGGHPDVIEVWWKVFAEERDWSSALECGQKLVALVPDRASAWITCSFALHELKRTREAFDQLRGVVDRFHDHFVIPYNLACYQCQLGEHAEAMKWLKQAVTVGGAATIRAMALKDSDLAPLRAEVLRLS
jgi:tetratricopeptide (TPR) repeat protein